MFKYSDPDPFTRLGFMIGDAFVVLLAIGMIGGILFWR